MRIGLTGGIGAGKSLAAAELARQGAVVVDVDDIARAQAKPGGAAHAAIVRAFGTDDRRELARRVFSDPKARRKLERITHPLVLAEMKKRMAKAPLAVGVVPLLFEAKLEALFDVTMTIEAPAAVRRRRVMKRDAVAAAAVGARMRAQLSDAQRARRADVLIRNNGRKLDFLRTVRSYHRALALLRHGAAAAEA